MIESFNDLERAGMLASEILGKGEVVDCISVDNHELPQSMAKETQPFYEKSLFKKLFGLGA